MQAAGKLGVEVVVGSEQRQAMATSMGDRALVVPLGDPEAAVAAIVGLHSRSPLDAIVAVDDQGVLVAAMASESLGLPHNPPRSVAATRDKAAMRARFADAGLRQPGWRTVGPGQDAGAAGAEVGWPAVIKPVSLSASRGVIRVDDAAAALAAAARIRAILSDAGEDPDGPLLVEQFIAGPEVALEGIVDSGHLRPLALFDKPDPMDGPFFEETIYVTPSRLPAAQINAIEQATAGAVRALGLREGPIHAEMRLRDGEVFLLEVAARSIGGLCARSLRFGLGVQLEELILRQALGMGIDELIAGDGEASGVMMLPIPGAGVLEGVRGLDQARAVPGVVGVEITIGPGRTVRPLPDGDRYLGFLFARGPTPRDVEGALRAGYARLHIVVTPAT